MFCATSLITHTLTQCVAASAFPYMYIIFVSVLKKKKVRAAECVWDCSVRVC